MEIVLPLSTWERRWPSPGRSKPWTQTCNSSSASAPSNSKVSESPHFEKSEGGACPGRLPVLAGQKLQHLLHRLAGTSAPTGTCAPRSSLMEPRDLLPHQDFRDVLSKSKARNLSTLTTPRLPWASSSSCMGSVIADGLRCCVATRAHPQVESQEVSFRSLGIICSHCISIDPWVKIRLVL